MANQVSATISIGASTTALERDIQRSLSKLERSIKFNPQLNTSNFALGRITGQVDDFSMSLDAANKRVLAFGANAAVIGTVYKAFKELTSATIQVDKALTEINAVFGLSSKSLQNFSNSLFNVARQTSQSFDSVSKAAQEFARQGLSVDETLKRVAGAMTLTRQSGLEVSKSVDAITAALNGFSRENLNVTQVINKLIAVDTKFAVSSSDLAEAISRVGNTASDAGVSFDELIGIVTSAQQITARGGAVIGNALKTIFTRLERSDTIDQLEGMGIAVRDLSNNALPATQVLKNLASNFDTLSASQKQMIVQMTAGTFQVNQLRAILGDLGKSYNTVTQAQEISASATNEAIKRNDILNKSLASLLQNTKTTATELGSIIGSQTFVSPLKDALSVINDNFIVNALRDSVTDKAGRTAGGDIAAGILQGIENVLIGPGAIAFAAIAGKLSGKLLGDTVRSFGGLTNARDKELKVTQGIQQVLAQSSEIDQQRFRSASALEAKERIILELLNQQNAAKAAQISAVSIAVSKDTGRKLKALSSAGGYLPIAEESRAIKMGIGGADSSARPVVIPNFAYGGGVRGPIVANSSEYIVPNFAGGGGSAIFNPNMVKSMGLPAGAKKIAAGGYIPNAAEGMFTSQFYGKNVLRSSVGGKLASAEQNKLINAAFEQYRSAVVSANAYFQKDAKDSIKKLQLTAQSKKQILDAFELEKISIKQSLKIAQQQVKEQEKIKASLEKREQAVAAQTASEEKLKAQVEKSVASLIRTQNKKIADDKFSSTQKVSPGQSFLAGQYYAPVQKANQTAVDRDEFLSQKYEKGRKQAYGRITESVMSGERSLGSLTGAQKNFLVEEFKEQGRKAAQESLGPGASQKAIKAFVAQYATNAQGALVNAFNESFAIKNQGSVYAQLEKNTSGLKGLFRSVDKQVEEIIKSSNLSVQAADRLRSQAGGIKANKSNRLQNAALGASFALPFIAGFVPEGESGTTKGKALGATSGVLQGAGFGASVGSFFGPAGTAIGAGAGTILGGFIGFIGKSSKSFEELSKTINDLNAKNNEQINSISNYIQLQQKINDAIQNGAPDKQIQNLLSQQSGSFAGIKSSNDRFALLAAGDNIEKLAQVLGEINNANTKKTAQSDVISSLGAAKNSAGLFSNLNGKDIEDAARALSVSVTVGGDAAKKGFDKLRNAFDQNPLGAFEQFAKTLEYDSELTAEILKQYEKNPDQLKLILKRFVGVFDESAKDFQKVEENQRKRQINIQYSTLLRKAGEQTVLSATLSQQNLTSQNRNTFTRQKAASEVSGGDSLEKLRRDNDLTLQSAINESNINFQTSLQKSIGELQSSLANKDKIESLPTNIVQDIVKLSNPQDFKNLAETLKGTNQEVVKLLNDSYLQLIEQTNNSRNQIEELKESNRISEILARNDQRNKILSASQFNNDNLSSFSRSRIYGRTSQFANGGKANQFNALNSQIEFGDQLGLGDTSDTQNLRNIVRGGSSNINFAKILSSILNREVQDNKEDISKAIDDVLGKKVSSLNDVIDQDFAKRIKAGIEVSSFSPEQAINEITKNGKVGTFASAGKVSIAEGSLITGISKLATPLDGVNDKLGVNGPIAIILKQIAENRSIAKENQTKDELTQRKITLQKRIDESSNTLYQNRFNSLSIQDIGSAVDRERDPNVYSSKIGDFLRTSSKKGKNSEETINALLNSENLLSEYGIDKNKLKTRLLNKAKENPIYSNSESAQLDEIKKLTEELSDLNNQINNLNNGIDPNNYSSGQRGRSSSDNFSLNTIDKKYESPFSYTRKDYNGNLESRQNVEGLLAINKSSQNDVEREYETSKKVNASYEDRIDLLIKLNNLQLEQAKLQQSAYGTFAAGFKSKILEMRKSLNDLSETGATVAASLESNLGNSFGDFVTGTKTGKEAFKDFIRSVLNDTARAMASKAMQQLIAGIASSFSGGYNSGGSVKAFAKGGKVNQFASGGSVPALLTGGEYYFTPKQVQSIESRYGTGYVDKINRGQAQMYATGGLVKGGSGVKDDVFAQLDDGGYVIKKNSVQKYGADNIGMIASGAVPQKRFWGGFLIGAAIGAGTSYATSDKKNRNRNALIGGIAGGIAGGMAQNYSQTGSAVKSDPNAGTFQFSPSSGSSSNYTGYYDSDGTWVNTSKVPSASSSTSQSVGVNSTQSQLKGSLIQAALAGAIGIGSSLAERKKATEEVLQRQLTREEIESLQNQEVQQKKSQGQFAYLAANNSGGQDIYGYGSAPATRRLASGGPVRGGSGFSDDLFMKLSSGGGVINKAATQKYGTSGLKKFADGGMVTNNTSLAPLANISNTDKSVQPNVIIKIDINNNGDSSSSSKSDQGNGTFGEEFAQKLSQNIRNVVRDEMIQQQRTGGMTSKLNRV